VDLLPIIVVVESLTPETDYGWKVHAALDAWTGKVDTKASIALAIESATLAFALSQSEEGKALADLSGVPRWSYLVGVALLLVAVGCALWVVFPRLRRRASRRPEEWRQNTIYFGHLRHWEPSDLANALNAAASPQGDQLSRQLVNMATIAWSKHAWLQWSLAAFAAGMLCLLGAAAG
jgi:hypothetical protein